MHLIFVAVALHFNVDNSLGLCLLFRPVLIAKLSFLSGSSCMVLAGGQFPDLVAALAISSASSMAYKHIPSITDKDEICWTNYLACFTYH